MGKIAVGVDLGATNIRVALGGDDGTIFSRIKERTIKDQGPQAISEQIIRMIRSLQPGKKWISNLQGIGIGSAGPLDLKRGGLVNPTNIDYPFVPLVKPLQETFGLNTYLLNDGLSAVMGEKFFGFGKKHENLAYITISSGIGGGIFVDNHLLIGKDGNATEIGHLTIDFEGRLICGCGRRGHWEAYCSGIGMPKYAKLLFTELSKENPKIKTTLLKNVQENWKKITSKTIFDSAKLGDKFSKEVIKKVGVLNSIGFASVLDAYDPSLITVGGSLVLKNENMILEPITQQIGKHAINRIPKICKTNLGDEIVLYGALALAYHPVKH
jgi:glucokinase